jgi:hypothetical protein
MLGAKEKLAYPDLLVAQNQFVYIVYPSIQQHHFVLNSRNNTVIILLGNHSSLGLGKS